MSERDETLTERLPIPGARLAAVTRSLEGPHTFGSSRAYWAGFIVVTALALAYPATTDLYSVLTTTSLLIWVFLSLSLTFVWGYTGIFSFGQTAFFGLGGYAFGVVGINLVELTGGTTLALVAAIILPALLAAVIGYFMFYGRVSGVYVGIITLATTLVLSLVFSRTAGEAFTIGKAALGGYNGMTGIPSLALGGGPVVLSLDPLGAYYFVVLVLILGYLAARYILQTDYGYVMVGIREDEDRTEMFGYDIRKIKLQVFTAAGAIAGFGGALYAAVGGFISPPIMGLAFAALPVIWVTVGGREALLGGILGTIGLRFLENELASTGSEFATIILGGLLLVAVLLIPKGIVPTAIRLWEERVKGVRE